MVDRFAIEREASERQAALLRHGAHTGTGPDRTATGRISIVRARAFRLAGVATLALALLWGSLISPVGGATTASAVGGGGGAIGYVP